MRSCTGKLYRLLAQFGAMTLDDTIEPDKVEPFLQKKADLQKQIEALRVDLQALKDQRKATARHIRLDGLPEKAQFHQLSTHSKQLIDTIKMIAYRAETAIASCLREMLSHPDQARRLLQALYNTEADLLPDEQQGTLTVRLHHMANASADAAIEKLCEELNATENQFPRTNLRLVFKLGSNWNPGDQVIWRYTQRAATTPCKYFQDDQ